MPTSSKQRRSLLTWLFFCLLFALCGVLGVLQYRWIGEVSIAARERLQGSLQASLIRLSQELNSEISAACNAFLPAGSPDDVAELGRQMVEHFRQLQPSARRDGLIREVGLAVPDQQTAELRLLNLKSGELEPAHWPPEWRDTERRIESNLARSRSGPGPDGGPPGPPYDGGPGRAPSSDAYSFETPIFAAQPQRFGPGPAPRREIAWVLFQLDPQFLREVLLPELIRRHLGTGGDSDYQVAVLSRSLPSTVIYESDPGQFATIANAADASVGLFDMPFDMFHRGPQGPGAPGPGPPGYRGRTPSPDTGRWKMIVRHRAGSLEAVVARTRRANLAVTGVVLLLMMASVAALIRFTRRAQRLAELQMDFVAGVSHELRTPLTVIHTAAYNLQGKLASQPLQVERYGALIQKESGRLKALVEQILRFASAQAGRAIESSRPLSMESVIESTLESSKPLIESSGFKVEKRVADGLPLVMGDAVALQHVLSNLLTNAVKYGARNGEARDHWIGVTASPAGTEAVEVRIADHGPGIPRDELDQIFDPFFRGARARDAQTHGSGLGLTIVKKIMEAHGGTISVKSDAMRGTEFILRVPVAPSQIGPEEGPE